MKITTKMLDTVSTHNEIRFDRCYWENLHIKKDKRKINNYIIINTINNITACTVNFCEWCVKRYKKKCDERLIIKLSEQEIFYLRVTRK